MSERQEDTVAEVDYLNMSDEEIANMAPPSDSPPPAVAETPVSNEPEEGTDAEDDTPDRNEEADEGKTAAEKGSEGLLTEKQDEVKEALSETPPASGKTESNLTPETSETPIDYKAEYERLLAPFKANGREIAVKGVDDAVTLMQMGANYNKKMAALKPNLKVMKLLENNGLLSEEKIGFLIDLEKRNPEAISKLVQDSGLDPLDLGAEKAGDYKPKAYNVDDREIELDTVLDELQSSPTYNQVLNIVSNVWDGPSKQVIANQPQLLKVIDSHVQSGIYDLIHKEIESERMFGRLDGLSDLEAYRQVGDAIQARGGFNHLGKPQGQPTPQKPVVIAPKPKTVLDDKLREKKRAASSTTPAGAAPIAPDYNPLALSDDAFSKLVNEKYL